jgi:hypothetical protein
LNTLRLKGPKRRKDHKKKEERRKGDEEKTKRIAAKAKVFSFDLKT